MDDDEMRRQFIEIWNGFDENEYTERKRFLDAILTRHRTDKNCPAAFGKLINRLIEMDQRLQGADDPSLEAFTLYHAKRVPVPVIAHKLNLSQRQVWTLIRKSKERMMLYLFGIDGLRR